MTTLSTMLADAAARSTAGDVAGAIDLYRNALAQAPMLAEVWFNLGALESVRNDAQAALVALDQAQRLRPQWAEPWHVRGRVLFGAQRYAEARVAFEEALAREPRHLAANVNLALTLHRLQRYAEAYGPLRLARDLAPTDETIWWLMRGNLLLRRRDEEALQDHLAFMPHAARSARVVVAELASVRRLGDAARDDAALAAVVDHPFASGESALVAEALALVQYFDVAPADMLNLYRTYDRLVREELATTGRAAAQARPRRGDGRVRIGYVSADFRRHVMGDILAGVIEAHDRERFEITLFSLAPQDNADAITARFRAASDAFVELAALDDDAAAQAIADRDIDLLIDLMGHSAFARPGIHARKPARLIVTHLGYHGALGLSSVAYKVSDAMADAPGNEAFQIEALLRLSRCLLPGRAYRAPVASYSRSDLGLAQDAVVCGAFVPPQKLSPRCVALWKQIVEAVPHAVLLFSPQREDDHVAIARRLAGFGIEEARVRFVAYEAQRLHDRYSLVDLALDTVPYTGGDTTLAALGAGAPVVTRRGARHAERVAASILGHAGLEQFVADTDQDYVALAVHLATQPAALAAAREAVRVAASDPMYSDPVVYARALESAWLRALAARSLLPVADDARGP